MQSPPAGGGGARDALNVPGILLIVLGGLGVLLALSSLATSGNTEAQLVSAMSNPDLPPQMKEMVTRLAGIGKVTALLSLLVYGLVIFGGVQMRNLKSYPLAVTAAIAAMLPCQCACCLGIPLGIWTLIVLFKPGVQAQFS